MRSRCKALKKKNQCDIIIIDYLQLINEITQKGRSRDNALGEISRALKALALELDVPVIAASQLNREVEKRADKEPILSDLRESGSLEQDADLVMFIFRPAYYFELDKWPHDKYRDDNGEPEKNHIEIIIAKQRDGFLGPIRVKHNDSITAIYDYKSKKIGEEPVNTRIINSIDPNAFYESQKDENPF
jgi:replicative DNA helicase